MLGSVPAASINPTAELCLAGRPRSRHLLGSLVLGLLMRCPLEVHSAEVSWETTTTYGAMSPLWFGRGMSTLHKGQTTSHSTTEITRAVLPRFGPPRGVKPYSYFGGLMVERWWWSVVHLPGKGGRGYACMGV